MEGTRRQDKEWEWTGRRREWEESEQACIHEPSTTPTRRTPHEAHSRHDPTSPRNQFTLKCPVVTQKGGAEHADENFMTIA